MDDRQDELQKEILEVERRKLTEAQREQHDRLCQHLRAEKVYRDEFAIALVRIVRTEHGVKKSIEVQKVLDNAQVYALERRLRGQPEAERQKEYLAQKAERQNAERAQDIEKQQAREQKEREAKELEKREAAKREPVPNAMQRFDALLAESKAQKAQTNAAAIDRAAQLADNRPNYARHDVLKNPQEPSVAKTSSLLEKDAERPTPRGEISEARAERLRKMFDKPSSDRYFDPTHDPSNASNYSNGRGGRGRGR